MRYRLTWLLAGFASVVVIAGVAALWRWEHSAVGISVGIPVAATLLTPLVSWAFSAQRRGGQPTPEQAQSAKQAVADFALEQWRRAAKAEPAWRGGAGTLEVHWIEPEMKDGSGAGTVATIAARLRDGQSCRLVVLGPAGSGKTTLARLLVTELLKPGRPDDQVPVLLPVSAWDPDLEGLHEWMVRWIADEVPGLGNTSNYGPAAVANLVNRGMVLPILDGLDVLPEAYRRSVLSSGDLLLQNRFVLTCRTDEFRAVSDSCPIGAVVLTADRVPRTEMMRFLHQVTERPRRWNELFGQPAKDAAYRDCACPRRVVRPIQRSACRL